MIIDTHLLFYNNSPNIYLSVRMKKTQSFSAWFQLNFQELLGSSVKKFKLNLVKIFSYFALKNENTFYARKILSNPKS